MAKRNGVDVRVLEGRRVQIIRGRFEDTSPVLERIGRYLVRLNQVGFTNQNFAGRPPSWAPRKVPNVAGILTDLAVGRGVSSKRFVPTPALVDTGTLRRSINFRTIGKAGKGRTVELFIEGRAAEYGMRMQNGEPTTIGVTQSVRSGLAALLRGMPALRPMLGWIFRRTSVTIRPRARQFFGIPPWCVPKLREFAREYAREGRRG